MSEMWVFTFGSGQQYAGHYVKFSGTWDEARQKMFDTYGEEWSMQYSEEEWEDWVKRRPPWVPLETELEN